MRWCAAGACGDDLVKETVRTAVEAAREAGRILVDGFSRPMDVSKKSPRELVTAMDRAAEDAVVGIILGAYPHDGILAEESAFRAGESGRVWIVDPLDGTNNYAHGYPFFSVAIAIEEDGAPVAGVVYDPLRDELFVAEAGLGATLNGEPLHVSQTRALSESLVATGFPYDRSESSENNLANFNRLILAVRGVRRAGSAELDLVYVACGRLDGYWELGLKSWDVAAGGVIVQRGRAARSRTSEAPAGTTGAATSSRATGGSTVRCSRTYARDTAADDRLLDPVVVLKVSHLVSL